MANGTVENTPTNPNVMSSITADGFTVESNFETPAELKSQFGVTEPAPDGDALPEERPSKSSRRNRREDPRAAVESAVAKQREAERLATEREERLAALEAENAELKKPRPAPVPTPPLASPAPAPTLPTAAAPAAPVNQATYKRYLAMPDAPKLDDFTGDTAFVDWQYAVSEFVADKRYDERSARDRQTQTMQSQRATFDARIAEETAKDPTFPEKLLSIPVDKRLMPYIGQHKQASDVMVYLVNHPEIAQELAYLQPDLTTDLPSAQQIERIGEIVGVIKAQSAAALVPPASARPAISQAKPPAKRVSGTPNAATDEPPGDDASEAEHDAYWGPRRAALRRRHR